jgi:hypothetical protein
MAHSDKNVIITPNVGSSTDDPKIIFSGADASASAQNITIKAYPASNGTLSIEGSAGQLFSVTNSMSGSIFSVNDVSGIPSIEVLDSGLIKFGQYSGNILLGTGTDSGFKLDVNGTARFVGAVTASSFSGAGTGLTGTASSLSIGGSSGSVGNAVTFNNGGSGAASGTTFNGSAAATISHNSIGALALAGGTLTGQLTSTLAWNAATGSGQIYINGATGNRIDFNTNGVAAPAFTTRSAGAKIVLYPLISGTAGDYALGIESNNMWFSVPENTDTGFKWYHGTTNTMSLLATGILSAVTGFRINNAATSGQYLRGNGTNFVSSAIQAADVPTLNQNTTGSAGSVAWSGITSKPTTLAGYGITNALIRGGGIGNIDFNAQRTLASGIYSVDAAPTNGPPASAYSNFIQMYERGDTAAQLVIEYSSGRMYSRGIQTAVPSYSPWRTQIDDGNYTSYAMPAGSSATNSVDVRSPIFYDSNDTYYYNDLNSSRRFAGRTYIHEWIEFVNFTGLYSPNNGAYFYPNDLTYGAWRIYGARNGWGGIEFSNASTTLMMNTDTYGFHYNGVGWRFYCNGGSGHFPGNVTAYWSDRRLKENLRPIGKESVDILSKLTAYRFNWNEKVKDFKIEIEPGKEEIGLIAQEVQDILPDAVVVNKSCSSPKEDGSGEKEEYLTINWNKITPILVQALNETRDELNNLKQLLTEKGIL